MAGFERHVAGGENTPLLLRHRHLRDAPAMPSSLHSRAFNSSNQLSTTRFLDPLRTRGIEGAEAENR
jgi:hypothetical protein